MDHLTMGLQRYAMDVLENPIDHLGLHEMIEGLEYLEQLKRDTDVPSLTPGQETAILEDTKIWLAPIWKAFAYIRDLIIRVIERITDMITNLFRSDIRTNDAINFKTAKYLAAIQTMSVGDRTELEKAFTKITVTGMLKFAEFNHQLHTFGVVCDYLTTIITKDIIHRIREIANPFGEEGRQMSDVLTPHFVDQLNTLYIQVSERGKVEYRSPIRRAEREQGTLAEHGFLHVTQVQEISINYRVVWTKYLKLRELATQLKEFYRELEQKERDIKRHDVRDRQVILDNLHYVQRHITMLLGLFFALRSCTTTINYRRKKLVDCIEKVIQLTAHHK